LGIGNGQATIDQFIIEGPSAKVEVSGTTNLVAKHFDQVVTVIPSIGTGVALAGAVAGGPLVGAAVYIADQVSGGAVDKLGSYQYEITGPWADAEIRRKGVLDVGGDQQLFLEHDHPDAQRGNDEATPAAAAIQRDPGFQTGPREHKPAAAPAESRARNGRRPAPREPRPEKEKNLFLEGH
jgi:hypothetical protein